MSHTAETQLVHGTERTQGMSLPGHNTSVVSTLTGSANMHTLLFISDKFDYVMVDQKHSPDCYQVYQGQAKEFLCPLQTAHVFVRGDS